MAYEIEFAESTKDHLHSLTANQRAIIVEAIENQLSHEPMVETRNRKRLRPNPIAPWELRWGDLRVFYEVTPDEPKTVRILAIGRKIGHRLYLAGKAVEL